ncbi:MAG: metal ABC transporter solute-binding protein, Zn/Mn family [Shewanella sp.]
MRINSKVIRGFGLALWLSHIGLAQAELKVFACEPEYASLVNELAPAATVYTATTALQDPHQVQARPSLIAKMRQADLVVCAGAELEAGWLPVLLQKSANPRVRSTELGLFLAAEHVDTLNKVAKVDRAMGDVHAMGNPHLHFDPERLLQVALALSAKLQQLDPQSAASYQQALADFTQRWQRAMGQWRAKAQGLQGKKVIAYHSSFHYLFHWLGIEQVADLEPKPGIAPTSGHLASLLSRASQGDILAVVVASYQDERPANWLAGKAGLPLVTLPMSVGGNDSSQDLFSLYDSVLALLSAKE